MAKIAVELEKAVAQRRNQGVPGSARGHMLASGEGWSVSDILCTSGPEDRAFEETHTEFSIAMVVAGSFQYSSTSGRALLAPGSLLLGNAGACFECGHEHAAGDRCISFKYAPEFFARLADDAGTKGFFRAPSLPAIRKIAPELAMACAAIESGIHVPWEELALQVAAKVLEAGSDAPRKLRKYDPASASRVTRIVREIERQPESDYSVGAMANVARLSPYHFLRVFQQQTGLTPHQYLLRTRLRAAAIGLTARDENILDIALDCGFGDVSNFNRAFRGEFGASPREFRRQLSV